MRSSVLFLFLFCCSGIYAQQRTDNTFTQNIQDPLYGADQGPVICIDSAHNNLHTIDAGFAPFARVARADGFRTVDHNSTLTDLIALDKCDILMVVNALHQSNIRNWVLPTPSAFGKEEVRSINEWVHAGGSLFLIADHMPFAGAATTLGESFGINFSNGFATLKKENNQPDIFSLENGRLKKSEISGVEITSVTSFTGSAFKIPEEAQAVLSFNEGDISLEPRVAWRFEQNTDTLHIEDYAQGALLKYGTGRVAVFGEAAMFTAQIIDTDRGTFKVGFNNPDLAPQNVLFLRKVLNWLAPQ